MQIVSTPPLAAPKTPVAFDTAVAGGSSFGNTTNSITVGGNNAVVIANCSGTSITGATLAGVAGTLLGTYANGSVYYWTGVSAGTKSVVIQGSGYTVGIIASYLNVTSIDSWATASGANAATITATTNDLVVSCFGKGSGSAITATSGSLRVARQNGDGTRGNAIIDNVGTSVTNIAGNSPSSSGSFRLAA